MYFTAGNNVGVIVGVVGGVVAVAAIIVFVPIVVVVGVMICRWHKNRPLEQGPSGSDVEKNGEPRYGMS